ncbi:hypothetical protein N7527_011080 [Penicillium freii]|nr:hypothetical protein N7527_011080 [Penicillium freii]
MATPVIRQSTTHATQQRVRGDREQTSQSTSHNIRCCFEASASYRLSKQVPVDRSEASSWETFSACR